MPAANPYVIYIELFKSDGVTRPNQNEIARVKAFDANGAVVTDEGQSGFNQATGGWMPVFMQNIAAFWPPREQPNLKFEVWNTAEQLVYTTQVFNAIPSGSTVKIVIGVSAEIVPGGWVVTGHVRQSNGTPVTSGTVLAFDVTNGSQAQLGLSALAADGSYSISFQAASFNNNGVPHAQPNLQVRAVDSAGQLLAESPIIVAAANNQVVDLTVATTPDTGQNRVFGTVRNGLGLPVSGILVQAFNVTWTTAGFQETSLAAAVTSDGGGNYEITYQDPTVPGTPTSCGPPAGQINLLVRATIQDTATPPNVTELATSSIIGNASRDQEVNLVVNQVAVSTSSEYTRLDAALSPCLGTNDEAKFTMLNQLNSRPSLLTFVAQTIGQDELVVRSYVRAWLIAGEINDKVGSPPLVNPMPPEVMYGLVRGGLGTSLADLISVQPDRFFDAVVTAIHQGVISASIEDTLRRSAPEVPDSLIDDWKTVLAKMMTRPPQSGEKVPFQQPLLALVFPDTPVTPEVVSPAPGTVAFGADTTTHNITLPSPLTPGDLLIILFTSDGSATVTTPSGWTQLWSTAAAGGSPIRLSGYAKVAVAGDAGAVVNFVTSAAETAAAHVYRIAQASWSGITAAINEGVAVGVPATASSTNPDPPSLAPPWGAASDLWLACVGHDANIAQTGGAPSGYSGNTRTHSGGSGTCTTLSAIRALAALSENPGSFTIATAEDWVAQTIAIRPGLISGAPKRELVAKANFDYQGQFTNMVSSLVAAGSLTALEGENLAFVFELYDKVGRYFPIVAAVYADKAVRGWKTIAELSTVPLTDTVIGGVPHKGWVTYANMSLSFSSGLFPGDVPGRTSDEKARVYGTRLHDLFGAASPQQRFAAALPAPDAPIATFLAANPSFTLEHGNIDKYLDENPEVTLPPATVDRLKQLQRVFRLTPDFQAADALVTQGYDSAVRIAQTEEGAFVAAMEQHVGGLTAARDIHRTASVYASEVLFTIVKFHQNLNEVGGVTAIPGAVSFNGIDPTHGFQPGLGVPPGQIEPSARKLPNWTTLFGDINKCACKHCQTVLSPGAYMVDLLEFIDEPLRQKLLERRADLADIEITCANTNTVLPYIDLVNEALEATVTPLGFAPPALTEAVWDQATAGNTGAINQIRTAFATPETPSPGEPPRQAYILGERAIFKTSVADKPTADPLQREWVIEDEAWRFSIRGVGAAGGTGIGPFAVFPSPQTSSTNDSLEVFPEHINAGAYARLAAALFPFNLPFDLGKEEVEVLLKSKKVPRHEILEAFTTLDRNASFANGTGALAYLGLTAAEAQAILAPQGAGLPQPWVYWGFDTDAVVSIPRPDKPVLDLQGTWIQLLALVPVFLHRTGLSYQELLDLLDTRFVHTVAADPHGLHVAGSENDLPECNINEFQIAHLNAETLRRISFFVRLWRRIGWTMRDLDTYLIAFEAGAIPASLVRLSQVKRLGDELHLAPREAFALWTNLDNRRSARQKKSLFDEVFLTGTAAAADAPETAALETIARGGSVTLPLAAPGADLRAHVRGALELKDQEVEILWTQFATTPLDLAKLTKIFRAAVLCRALGLPVAEFFDLVELTETDPFGDGVSDLGQRILRTYAAVLEIARARSARMKAAEMTYLLTGKYEPGDPGTPSRADLETFARRLAAAVGELAAAFPDNATPDAAALGTLLGRIVPANRIVRAIEIVTNASSDPPPGPTHPDFKYLEQYFGPFLGANPAAFLANLFAEESVPARYAMVFAELNPHLLDQAKTGAALLVTSEVYGIDQGAASLLLTESLSSVASRPSALHDWKALLGGGWLRGSQPEPIEAIDGVPSGVFRAVVVAPRTGRYQLILDVAAADASSIDATLSIDEMKMHSIDNSTEITPEQPQVISQAGANPTVMAFPPRALQAGAVLNVRLEYNHAPGGTPDISLLWKIDDADPVVVPSTATLPLTIVVPAIVTTPQLPVAPPVYLKLFKATRLAKGLAFTKSELRHVVENQPPLPGDPLVLDLSLDGLPILALDPAVPWADLAALIDRLGLNRSIRFKTGTLFDFWRDVTGPTADDIENQTGWKAEDVSAILGLFAPPPALGDPAPWFVLRAAMDIVRRLDIRAAQIVDLLVNAAPTIAAAATLRQALRSRLSKQSWKEIMKPLRDPLRQRQRDALVGYLTSRPITIGGADRWFIDANDLFSFFLIDVLMEPDTLISRIKLALNALQLFVERVFLGLEDASALSVEELEDKKAQWVWMNRFRVWEANRKVFLYPENYIEPELRDDKTELFRQVEEELTENPISDDKGHAALVNYLDGLNEVANVEIIGTFAEETPRDSGVDYILHVVGRTRSQPRTHYYRTFEAKPGVDGTWTPWRRIPVEIATDVIAPVVFNGRLHLFWPSIRLKQKPHPTTEHIDGDNVGQQRTQHDAEIRLMSTEYVAAQDKWLKPRRSKSRVIDPNPPTLFDDPAEEQPPTNSYHLRVAISGADRLAVEIVKTNYRFTVRAFGRTFTGTVTDLDNITVLLDGASVPIKVKDIPDDTVITTSSRLLGAFQYWFTGEDAFEESSKSVVLGKNWPAGTLLKHNVAEEVGVEAVGLTIGGQRPNDQLQFKDNVPFFDRTPGTFRVFGTNLGYLEPAEDRPFFYETDTKSLFALNKGTTALNVGFSINLLGITVGLSQILLRIASFRTFHHPLVRELQKRLHFEGRSGLMNRLTEALPYADNRIYANYYPNNSGNLYLGYHIAGDSEAFGVTQRQFEAEHYPHALTVQRPYPLPTVEFAYGAPFGVYNWELFFHLPMLIAERLKQDLKFEDALRWYHYVFDPKQDLNTYEQTRSFADDLPPGARYWTFLPFFANRDTTDSLLETLGLKQNFSAYERDQLTALIDDWRRNPFKPHLIARQRMSAYQKFVFMKYLDNLIAWGDDLFRRDTFETINEATQLYILAGEMLGQRPQVVEPLGAEQKLTYRELQAIGIDALSNAILDVEYQIVGNRDNLKTRTLPRPAQSLVPIRSLALKSFFFCVPRNERLDSYWETVADRLFKIRNSMNIDGVKRALALFEPPIDPALLVRAAAAGLDLGAVVAQLNAPPPHYRYTVWLQKALDLCNELRRFGADLLAAMEKRDGEALQLLRQDHEIRMLELVRRVRERQVAEAEENIEALELSRALAEERYDEYRNREKESSEEHTQITKTEDVKTWETRAGAAHALTSILSPIPDGKVGMVGPFPLGSSDLKIGTALFAIARAAAEGASTYAAFLRGEAAVAGLKAGIERRWEDWKLQERLAFKEIAQINQQIAVARIRLAITERELANHETQMAQAEELRDFLRDKFTSRELYNWMVTELGRTYQLVYKLAFDAAKTAERAFQFELGVEDSFIQYGYVDSLRQGLLAGDKLVYDLKRLEVAYCERNKREMEITKPISLAALDGEAVQRLRETGVCDFELPEILFDLDFPGHYFRRIKTVRLTIPCVTGPHTSVSAKLTLLGSAFRKDARVESDYPYEGLEDTRFVHNPVGIQAIAAGSAQGDAGLFNLDFRDDRYLPFEGAGAMSRWRLELPTAARQFDYNTISDVVIQLSYTAREGGETLKAASVAAINERLNAILTAFSAPGVAGTGLVRAFSLRQEFPDVLHRLLTATGPVQMTLLPEHFPFLLRDNQMPITVAASTDVHVVLKPGQTPANPTLKVNNQLVTFTTGPEVPPNTMVGAVATGLDQDELFPPWTSRDVTLEQTNLTLAAVEDIVFLITYTVGQPGS